MLAGGYSNGCPLNAGAAGTYFDASVLSLRVDNDNMTTETETPLLDFSTSPLWTNVYVENNAKALVPLLWTRVQVNLNSIVHNKTRAYMSIGHLVCLVYLNYECFWNICFWGILLASSERILTKVNYFRLAFLYVDLLHLGLVHYCCLASSEETFLDNDLRSTVAIIT